MSMPMKKGQGLSWNPASVELPEIPTVQAGQDALSSTIAAVLPTLGAELAANVATLQAKEGMFAGKLGAAEAAYQTSDDQGSQSVGQIVSTLGQMGQQAGQMAQQGGGPMQALGGQSGMFGSLMQQAMQAAQSGGGQSAGGPGAGVPGGGPPAGITPGQPAATGQQPPREDPSLEQRVERLEERAERSDSHDGQHQRAEREPLQRADDRTLASGPQHVSPGAGPVPTAPPEHARRADDTARNL
jgi:hypothetical protein